MLTSMYENLGFDNAVSNVYTANSTAELIKSTIQEAIKLSKENSDTEDSIIKTVDYNEDNSEKTIADILKDYTLKTSDYIKELGTNRSNTTFKLTKEDYEKVGMSGYYDAQINLNYSKAITNYMKNNFKNPLISSTFSISV